MTNKYTYLSAYENHVAEVAFVALHVQRHQTYVITVTGKQNAKQPTIQYEQCS
jgi:hypothetical protein